MAKHWVNLTQEPIFFKPVGNSISTIHVWDPDARELEVWWHNHNVGTTKVPAGIDTVIIDCWGGQPRVTLVTPPKNPLKRTFWNRGFHGGMRRKTEGELLSEFESFSSGYGIRILVRGHGFAFAYKGAWFGGTPALWWAEKWADTSNIDEAIGFILHINPPMTREQKEMEKARLGITVI